MIIQPVKDKLLPHLVVDDFYDKYLLEGVWKELEAFERDLANFYEVKVRVEVYFSNQKVPGGATIPSGFRKMITFGGKQYVFVFPNEDTKGTKWIDYLVE